MTDDEELDAVDINKIQTEESNPSSQLPNLPIETDFDENDDEVPDECIQMSHINSQYSTKQIQHNEE